MSSRALAGALAVLMAAVATIAVFMYVNGVRNDAEGGGNQIQVVVSKEDIAAGTDLDELISEGAFTTQSYGEEAVVDGAVTDLNDLAGRTSSVPILAGEQISTARLTGSDELQGGVLGIPANHEAVTMSLDAQRQVGRDVVAGDNITVFGSFKPPVSAKETTVNLVSEVRVLKVFQTTGENVEAQNEQQEALMTLALSPRDAQRIVFAKEHGTVWFTLLPPGQDGSKAKPVEIEQVAR